MVQSETAQRADPITRVIARRVAQLRKAAGMSQADLAARLAEHRPGWSRPAVTKLESGARESVSVADLLALGLALDVPPVMLLADPRSVDEVPLAADRGRTDVWDALRWLTGDGLSGVDPPTAGSNYLDAAALIRAARELPAAVRELNFHAQTKYTDRPESVEAARRYTEARHRDALQTITTCVSIIRDSDAPIPPLPVDLIVRRARELDLLDLIAIAGIGEEG